MQTVRTVHATCQVRYRAVDCDSGAAISRTYVSPTIFSAGGGIQPGWGWTSYGAGSATLQQSASPGTLVVVPRDRCTCHASDTSGGWVSVFQFVVCCIARH